MCLPGGARDESVSVGMTISMYGRLEKLTALREDAEKLTALREDAVLSRVASGVLVATRLRTASSRSAVNFSEPRLHGGSEKLTALREDAVLSRVAVNFSEPRLHGARLRSSEVW